MADKNLSYFFRLQFTDIGESAKERRALKSKRIKENRNILSKIENTNWDSIFTCRQCSEKIDTTQAAFEHMVQNHPLPRNKNSKKSNIKADFKTECDESNVNCIECDTGPLKGRIQFKIHLWRHR